MTLAEYASDEEWDMSSGSHSARRGYPPIFAEMSKSASSAGSHDSEQDLTGFPGVNLCVVCKVDMGECNPRQYCCKTYCPMEEVAASQALEEVAGATSAPADNEETAIVTKKPRAA